MRSLYLMVAGTLLWIAALVLIAGVLPLLRRLPPDYENRLFYSSTAWSRAALDQAPVPVRLIGRRVERTMVNRGRHAFVQADVYWARPDGTLEFENAGLYGVDRYSRANKPGLGSASRTGQFMFPPGVERREYEIWDPSFVGPRTARYAGIERRAGLSVYVFHFTVRALDETAGYVHLPDVPERYRVATDGGGTLWVEPVSGRVVDYLENGRSYLVTSRGGQVGDVFIWKATFTQGSRRTETARAAHERRLVQWLGWWLPGLLTLAGAAAWLAALYRSRRGKGA